MEEISDGASIGAVKVNRAIAMTSMRDAENHKQCGGGRTEKEGWIPKVFWRINLHN